MRNANEKRIDTWCQMASQQLTEYPGQYQVRRIEGEETEPASIEDVESGAQGTYALFNIETGERFGQPCRVSKTGVRRPLGSIGNEGRSADLMTGVASPFASIGRQSLAISEGWEKLCIIQREEIKAQKEENARLRAELDAAKDEMREMSLEAAGGIESEIVGVVKDLVTAYQGSNERAIVKKLAEKFMGKLSISSAKEVSELLISEGYANDGKSVIQ